MQTSEPGVPLGTKGPDDDFFCHKYQVWYQVDDCVYRGQNQTFPGCANCFQGHLNIRSVESWVARKFGSSAPQPIGSSARLASMVGVRRATLLPKASRRSVPLP